MLGSLLCNHDIECKIFEDGNVYNFVVYKTENNGKVTVLKEQEFEDVTDGILTIGGYLSWVSSDKTNLIYKWKPGMSAKNTK